MVSENPSGRQDMYKKILFVCTEDWFFKSHFLPIAKAAMAREGVQVSLLARTSGAREGLEEFGVNIIPFDFNRSSKNPFGALKIAFKLSAIIRREKPDVIHLIALKSIAIGGLIALFLRGFGVVYHVTGLGYLADGTTFGFVVARNIVFRFFAFCLMHTRSWLVCENPDDLAFIGSYGAPIERRVSVVGGAGVDPSYFFPLPPSDVRPVHVAYVGRMIWTKGVDVLVEAISKLAHKGVAVKLDLYGSPDPHNPKSIEIETLENWNQKSCVAWHGPVTDVREVWKICDIAVVSTRTREGMPRSMLEAAASERPLIVTDIPGCRSFVRDGVEGLVVPPGNSDLLADAIEKLAREPALRLQMGQAARRRVLDGYTEVHVAKDVLDIYDILYLEGGRRQRG